MKLVSCFCALLISTVLAASAVLADPLLTNGDRWPVSSPRALAVGGSHVCMARGNVLTILDASLGPTAKIDLEAEIRGISYADNHVYAALGSDGLAIVDLPASSVVTIFKPADESSVGSVFVSGNYAYITNIGNRFKIVDISTPVSPVEKSSETLSGLLVSAVNVYVAGDVAAVVDQVNGLHLLNVADKDNPQWQSVTPIAGAFDVRLAGKDAYVASISGGLDIVDISDISDPDMRGSYTPADGYSTGVFVSGNTAWLADQVNGLHRINIADKNAPSWERTYSNTTGAHSVATEDGTSVYVCDYEKGLQEVVNRADDFRSPADARRLFVDDDDYLYVVDSASAGEGLRILDAYYPGSISYESFVETPGQAQDVFVAGNYAYVADGDEGLMIIDVSDKDNPAAPIQVDTNGTAYGVFVSGDYAYVADGTSGLQIIDVSDKNDLGTPVQVGTDGTAYDVFVSGSYAYVASGTAGLHIIDLSDNSALQVATGGTAYDVFVSGNYAYIADGTNGLVSLDVSDPADPTKVEDWSTGTTAIAQGVHVVGEYVYVAEGLGGAAIYRLTDEDPFIPTPLPDSDSGGGCFITGLAF